MFSSLTHPGEDNDGYWDEAEESEITISDEEFDEEDRDEEQGRWEAADDRLDRKSVV